MKNMNVKSGNNWRAFIFLVRIVVIFVEVLIVLMSSQSNGVQNWLQIGGTCV